VTAPRGELLAALERLLRVTSARSVLLSHAVAEQLGMNQTDLETLDLLTLDGPMPAGRLAELTGLTTGAITGVVDRLEKLGLAGREPDPADRRRVIVRALPPPEPFRRCAEALYAPLAAAMEQLAARYDDAELAAIVDFLGRANQASLEATAAVRRAGPRPAKRVRRAAGSPPGPPEGG
jgi:DNA-binding MarR family transcriptional regulator